MQEMWASPTVLTVNGYSFSSLDLDLERSTFRISVACKRMLFSRTFGDILYKRQNKVLQDYNQQLKIISYLVDFSGRKKGQK